MRIFGLIVLIIVIAVGAFVWTLPLAEIVKRLPVDASRLSLGETSGTWRSGRVGPVVAGGRPVGVIEFDWQPGGLFSGQMKYEIDLTGPGVTADGFAARSITSDRLVLSDVHALLDVAQFPGLADGLRVAGGRAVLQNVQIVLDGEHCVSASGRAQTDALVQAETVYGFVGPELAGDVRCENGVVVVPLEGTSARDDRIRVEARFGGGQAPSIEARIDTTDPDLQAVLIAAGFMPEGTTLVLRPDMGL